MNIEFNIFLTTDCVSGQINALDIDASDTSITIEDGASKEIKILDPGDTIGDIHGHKEFCGRRNLEVYD